MLVDTAAHLGRSASSSFAKYTSADFKISFARRNSQTSRRSFLISSRSTVVGRSGRVPLSASAWRTRLRNPSELIPRSLATCAIGRPDSNTSRTPRSSSSSGYFRGLAIVAEHPSGQNIISALKVSVEPGWLKEAGGLVAGPGEDGFVGKQRHGRAR